MSSNQAELSLLIVSEDWFARRLLECLALETGHFAHVVAVDDGYSALAELWDQVERGTAPNVFMIDQHNPDPSAARLIAELRREPVTQNAYVAVLTGERPEAFDSVEFVCTCTPADPAIEQVFGAIAQEARQALHSRPAV